MQMGFLSRHNQRQSWRIRGVTSAVDATDYGQLLATVRERITASLADAQGQIPAGVAVHATGIMPLVHQIQRQLMADLQQSFCLAFLVIAVVMTVVQGSLGAGLVAMLPNILPTLLMFGTLGWCGWPVDIGSVMTASVALGIAVDDTLHFLTSFQRALRLGHSRRESVQSALAHCSRAMVQSSLVCAAGMSVFALSDFLPTARFAWLMVALFAAALLGDLVLLPALLLGPLGRFWEERLARDAMPATDYVNSATSTVNPGPKASSTHGPPAPVLLRRSRINTTVGDDMLP
jgi:predicted RND superfamily exporter protein